MIPIVLCFGLVAIFASPLAALCLFVFSLMGLFRKV